MGKNGLLKGHCKAFKAAGMQKLGWYCQMCRKQCRDENGFKCHCLSDGHHRQMQIFGESQQYHTDGFSHAFEMGFLEHVKRSHQFGRVAANTVYNEYISDRHHIHMNSTQWASLTDFVKYLGRTGKCKVDETDKGYFVTYIDHKPEMLLREQLKHKRRRAELADEDRHEKAIEQQIDRATKGMLPMVAPKDFNTDEKKMLQRNEEEGKIVFAFMPSRAKIGKEGGENNINGSVSAHRGVSFTCLGEVELTGYKGSDTESGGAHGRGAKLASAQRESRKGGANAHTQLMEEDERPKGKANRRDCWLVEGLVVKVMSKSLAEKGFYKQKGVVRMLIGKYAAEIKMLESSTILKVDQEELETVIPQIGGLVKIVNGAYKGSIAKLVSINVAKFTAKVQVEKGIYDGRVLNAVEYEDICKVSTFS